MAGTFLVDGINTTVTFEYAALTTTVQSVVGDAAEYLFDKGYGNHGTEEIPIVFADLTNQEKLDIVDAHVRSVILALANTHKSVKAQEAAREVEASSEYDI